MIIDVNSFFLGIIFVFALCSLYIIYKLIILKRKNYFSCPVCGRKEVFKR